MRTLISIFFSIVLLALNACSSDAGNDKIVGIKTYRLPEDINETLQKWTSLGINTVFVSKDIATNTEFTTQAKKQHIAVYLITPVFYNPKVLKKHPEWYAVQSDGKIAKEAWVEFICPSNKEFQQQLIDSITNFVQHLPIDGVSLDFIRHFLFWEKIHPNTHPDSIVNTCFCRHCLEKFEIQQEIQVSNENTAEAAAFILENYPEAWSSYKQKQITDLVKKITTAINTLRPEVKINLHAVPWTKTDFEGAVLNKAGQNIRELATYCDYISPMVYHHMTFNNSAWIKKITDSLHSYAPNKILPSIQVNKAYRENDIHTEDFNEAIEFALANPSQGVILWSWEYLEKDRKKQEILSQKILE